MHIYCSFFIFICQNDDIIITATIYSVNVTFKIITVNTPLSCFYQELDGGLISVFMCELAAGAGGGVSWGFGRVGRQGGG